MSSGEGQRKEVYYAAWKLHTETPGLRRSWLRRTQGIVSWNKVLDRNTDCKAEVKFY
jgi:hypothetical protein